MTNYSTPNSKKNKLQKRIFTPKLTESDTIAFTFLAAEQGLTPDKLIESFVNDIVSSFCNDEITEEKNTYRIGLMGVGSQKIMTDIFLFCNILFAINLIHTFLLHYRK